MNSNCQGHTTNVTYNTYIPFSFLLLKYKMKNKNNTKNEKKSLNIGAGNFESIPYRRFLPYYFFKAVYYFVW